MGGGLGGSHFTGTAGHKAEVIRIIDSLPKNPDNLLRHGWKEITHPAKRTGTTSRDYIESKTGLKILFDKGDPTETGFKAIDHYHVRNPNSDKKAEYYLDRYGNPIPKNSAKSHIIPR